MGLNNPNRVTDCQNYNPMTTIDLNSDLGESFGPWKMGDDESMLGIVSSANVACGGHAGDANTMFDTLTLAKQNGVSIGAHPGFDDKPEFGRRLIPMSPSDVEKLVAVQTGALMGMANLTNATVKYVKAHGALANWAAAEESIARAVANAVKQAAPDCALLAISGTELEKAGNHVGLNTFSEIFADRAYQSNGQLVPRSQDGAVIKDAQAASERLLRFLDSGDMPTIDGGSVRLKADSICIHGDNPAAVAMARTLKQQLENQGIQIAPFVS